MKSALRLLLGVSVLSSVVGCSSSGDDTGGPKAVGGSSGSGSGGSGVVPMGGTDTGTGGGGSVDLPPGIPLTPMKGWVDGMSNELKVQGAMFSYADDTSKMGMTEDFSDSNACIKGTAAKVDLKCTPVPPATDCYGTFWGAAIGLNMNQPIDMATGMGGTAMPFDASAITGFAFEIAGNMVPGTKDLRFKVEGPSGEFCNTSMKPVKAGVNQFTFDDLITQCWKPAAGAPTASTTKTMVLKIAWQVVTNSSSAVPFDFCVKNVRALQ